MKPPDVLTSGEIYPQVIKQTDTALVIGPSKSIFHDPSLLQVASLIQEPGRILIVDPQENGTYTATQVNEIENHLREPVIGYGNLRQHLRQITHLREIGIPLRQPEWLGPNFASRRINLTPASIDVIVDHGTSLYLAGRPHYCPETLRLKTLRKIYHQYAQVLKPRGTLLLQGNPEVYGLQRKKTELSPFHAALFANGLKIHAEHNVTDAFSIPITAGTAAALLMHQDSLTADENQKNISHYVQHSKHGPYLNFSSPDHNSSRLYLIHRT